MTYQNINGTLMGNDLTYIFLYTNEVTHGLFILFTVIAFFLIIAIGSSFMQIRFSSRLRPEVSALTASFVTLGFATILQQRTGMLDPTYFMLLIGITILSIIWVAMSTE